MRAMEIHERLQWARERRNFASAAEAAQKLRIPYGTYSGHENGLRGIPRKRAVEYARAFRVSLDWLLTGEGSPEPRTVPIVGLAGAGPDSSILFSEAQGEIGEAPMPVNGTETTVALEVRGDSMRGIADDGALIYYDDRRDPPTADMLGQICVVGLEDGRVLVKYLSPGRKRHSFTLTSVAAPDMMDVRVAWAALVTAIIPPRAAQQMIRKGAA